MQQIFLLKYIEENNKQRIHTQKKDNKIEKKRCNYSLIVKYFLVHFVNKIKW